MKSYRWCIVIFATLKIVELGSPNLHLFKDDTKSYCVISNETKSTAVTLTRGKEPVIGSPHSDDEFFCKTSTDRKCEGKFNNSFWNYHLSTNYDLPPITDRRWEDFDLVKTGLTEFINVHTISNNEDNFSFKISVKIRADAYIFLCDGGFPPKANCYWLIIGGWNGGASVARKCKQGTVPKMYETFSNKNNKCAENATATKHDTPPVNDSEWSDFVIAKNHNKFNISSVQNELLLDYEDKDNHNHFRINYILVASLPDSPGEWKINDITSVYRTGIPYNIQRKFDTSKYLRFSVLPGDIKGCMLYVYLCESDLIDLPCYKIDFSHNNKPTVCTLKMNISNCNESVEANITDMPNFSSWVHFALKTKYNNDTVEFHEIKLDNDQTLIKFANIVKINPKHVYIGSNKPASWKIHSYGIFTATETNEIPIDLETVRKHQYIRYAVLAYSCPQCNLTFEIQDQDGNTLDSKEQLNKTVWEEIKLKATLQNDVKVKLIIKLNSTNGGRAFIGDIRNCSKNFRVISANTTNGDLSCKALRFPDINVVTEKENLLLIHSESGDTVDIVWVCVNGTNDCKIQTLSLHMGCDVSENAKWIDHVGHALHSSLFSIQLKVVPYTKYDVKLIDSNNKSNSTNFHSNVADISHEKFPHVTCTQSDDNIIVNLTIDDCKQIKGPLYYHMLETCDKWCSSKVSSKVVPAKAGTLTEKIPDIYGLSYYKVLLSVSRSNVTNTSNHEQVCNLMTTATVPQRVPNITLYSKTSTSISLRWKEPYPITGELEKYVIEYRNADKPGGWLTYNITTFKKCNFWKEYICASLENLEQNANYKLKVRAKNKGIDMLSYARTVIAASTKEEAPVPPENIKLAWDNYLNLTVSLLYPFEAVGPVRQLYIIINTTELLYDIDIESRNYSIQINAQNLSMSFLNIKVKLSNMGGNSTEIVNSTYSPPKIPKILERFVQKADKKIRVNTSAVADLQGETETFLFRINCTKKNEVNLKGNCEDINYLRSKSFLETNLSVTPNSSNILNFDSVIHFVVFLKNSFKGHNRCAVYSDIPYFEPNGENPHSKSVVWVFVTLFILCLCMGTIIYIYKKKKITYRPICLSTVLTKREEGNISFGLVDAENKEFSYLVPLAKFENYLNEEESQSELERQYSAVEALDVKSQTVGLIGENLRKNRYKNIIAYDETRVVLESLYNNVNDDYINANYIKGFDKERSYIATQGPTAVTLGDFWRMIWQENVECVVMLSRLIENGKKKCEQYWPEVDQTLECNDFTITCTNITTDEDIITRTLIVSFNSEKRTVTQLHYTGWLDKDVPTSTQGLQNIMRLMKDFSNGPVVVHCSAGVGRTGTLIMCDIAVKMAMATQTVDMFSILYDLRQQRSKMVQIFDQYVFAHQVVKDAATRVYQNIT